MDVLQGINHASLLTTRLEDCAGHVTISPGALTTGRKFSGPMKADFSSSSLMGVFMFDAVSMKNLLRTALSHR